MIVARNFATNGNNPDITLGLTQAAHAAEQATGDSVQNIFTKILIELQVISYLLANVQPSCDDLGQLRKSISDGI